MSKPNPLRNKNYVLGRTIQTVRQRKGLTQEQLSEKVGITHNYLAIIEIGHKMPSMKVLMKIADTLGVKTRDLISF